MLNLVKSWSVTCGLRLNGLDSSVWFLLGFSTPSGVSRVVCRRPSLLSCTAGHAAALAVIPVLRWRVNGSRHVNRFLASTHKCRAWDCMDRQQEPFHKSYVWPNGNRVKPTQLCWRMLNQLYHIAGVDWYYDVK